MSENSFTGNGVDIDVEIDVDHGEMLMDLRTGLCYEDLSVTADFTINGESVGKLLMDPTNGVRNDETSPVLNIISDYEGEEIDAELLERVSEVEPKIDSIEKLQTLHDGLNNVIHGVNFSKINRDKLNAVNEYVAREHDDAVSNRSPDVLTVVHKSKTSEIPNNERQCYFSIEKDRSSPGYSLDYEKSLDEIEYEYAAEVKMHEYIRSKVMDSAIGSGKPFFINVSRQDKMKNGVSVYSSSEPSENGFSIEIKPEGTGQQRYDNLSEQSRSAASEAVNAIGAPYLLFKEGKGPLQRKALMMMRADVTFNKEMAKESERFLPQPENTTQISR